MMVSSVERLTSEVARPADLNLGGRADTGKDSGFGESATGETLAEHTNGFFFWRLPAVLAAVDDGSGAHEMPLWQTTEACCCCCG